MAAGYREVERKYDVSAEFELPAVSDLLPVPDGQPSYDAGPPQTIELDATYFDTADHRLLHAGLTLRRRTGGADAGWHLKVPTPDGERVEIRAALGRSERTVPLRLRRLVWIHTRDGDLVPVLRLRTTRTETPVRRGDEVLAVIADDRVSAERLLPADGPDDRAGGDPKPAELHTWREVEVELVEGDQRLLKQLDRSLRKQGAARSGSRSKLARGLGQGRPAQALPSHLDASAPAAEVVVAYLAAERDHLAAQDLAVRLDQPDSIHQMRVATRRLRSTLRTFAPLFTDGATASAEAELKWLGQELGAARDAEVMRAQLAEDLAQEREHQQVSAAVARGIDRAMARAQQETFAEVVAALDSGRYRQLVAAVDELLAAPPLTEEAVRPAGKKLVRPVRRAARKVERALAAAGEVLEGPERNTALHEVRKKAKRARYAGEALTPAFGDRAAAFAAAMERLQDLLGEHHDTVTLQARLEQLTRDGEPSMAFTLGRVHAAEGRRQAELEVEIASAAKAATKKSLRSWLG